MHLKPPGVVNRKPIDPRWRRRSRFAVLQRMLRVELTTRLKSAFALQSRTRAGAASDGAAAPRSTTVNARAAVVRTRRPYTLTRRRWVNFNGMVQFAAPAEHYDRFMGRYVPRLAVALADAAGVAEGMRALDVGCGPGGLTHELVGRLGADHVAAIDPSPQFAAANRERHPGVDVRDGAAESLPFDGGMTMLSTFWRAVRTVEPGAQGE